jgi:hypothetical protein
MYFLPLGAMHVFTDDCNDAEIVFSSISIREFDCETSMFFLI